ncbi:MAG: carboxypeptidase-like regulatory domain-containing protein, partial [Bacteroidota bacterium]
MKTKNLLFVCVLLFSLVLRPQTAPTDVRIGTVTGKIIDKTLGEPVPFAAVVIKSKADNATVTGGITKEDGTFEVKRIPEGTFIFEVQFIGYKNFQQEISISRKNRNINLGTITLEEDVAQLEGVDVVAERSTIEQKVDRKIINVGKDLTTAGATAADIMNNIP